MTTGRSLAAVVLLLFLVAVAAADTLYLKNGKKFEGKVVSRTRSEVKFKTSYGTLTFPVSRIDRIEEGKTKLDEYRERVKKIPEEDFEARLELARWCGEVKLRSQRRSLLRGILKRCPNHPETHRELGEVYRDGGWKKGDAEYPEMAPGDAVKLPGSVLEFRSPKTGWSVLQAERRTTLTGPDVYATAPILTVTADDPESPLPEFAEKEGWEEPTETRAGGLTGQLSRRATVEEGLAMVEWVAALRGAEHAATLRLECLQLEEKIHKPAFDQALKTLKAGLPRADYVNTYYKYQVNLPKPADKWEWREDEVHDLCIRYKNSNAIEWCKLNVWGADPGQEWKELDEIIQSRVARLKVDGIIEEEGEIRVGGEKGRMTKGTYLEEGIPCRGIYVRIEHGKRLYFIEFDHHEYGGEKTLSAFETIVESLRFTE